MKPRLIHPVYIEICFPDKSGMRRNTKLRETIGEPTYLQPIRILGQHKASIRNNQMNANMVKGGVLNESDGYFLVYPKDLPRHQTEERVDLKKMRTALITKVAEQVVKWKIIDACDVTHYHTSPHFIKLEYTSIKEG